METDKHRARTPYTVVLINDDRMAIIQAKEALRKVGGCKVFVAENGQEGLELLRDHHADVVFLNLMMPVMSGYEVLEALRGSRALRESAFVIWTMRSRPRNLSEFKAFGVSALRWLHMPHDERAFLAALWPALRRLSARIGKTD